MQYRVLRNIACRERGQAIRLNTYIAFDESPRSGGCAIPRVDAWSTTRRCATPASRSSRRRVQHYTDNSGVERSKANADIDMAVDCLLQSSISTASCSYRRWRLRAGRARAAELAGSVSRSSRSTTSRETFGAKRITFLSGYSPGALIPSSVTGKPWASRVPGVAGVCYYYPGRERKSLPAVSRSVRRQPVAARRARRALAYAAAAFHVNNMPSVSTLGPPEPRDRVRVRARNGRRLRASRARDITVSTKYPAVDKLPTPNSTPTRRDARGELSRIERP